MRKGSYVKDVTDYF